MSRRGPAACAVGGGAALAVSLALPWFTRRLSSVFAPVAADRPVSGWVAVGGLGGLMLVLALAAVVWGVLRERNPSALWVVVAGALALMIISAATVTRVGADGGGDLVTTTSPSPGLGLAFAGALAIVLAGMAALVGEARRRTHAP